MTAPNYSGEAVVVFNEAGFGDGMWRASCPIDCGWHGNDHVKREDAVTALVREAKQHKCLRAPAVPESRPTLRATEGGQGDG